MWDFEVRSGSLFFLTLHKNEELQKLMEKEIEQIEESQRTDNNITVAFIKATNKSMKITNGEQAMRVSRK